MSRHMTLPIVRFSISSMVDASLAFARRIIALLGILLSSEASGYRVAGWLAKTRGARRAAGRPAAM